MRILSFVLLALMVVGVGFGQTSQGTSSVAVSEPALAISIADDVRDTQCNVSEGFVDAILPSILEEMRLSGYAYTNVSDTNCYQWSDYKSVNFNIVVKNASSDITGKVLGVSFYVNDVQDYDVVFTPNESKQLGWNLKRRYADHLINGTIEEFYVQAQPLYNSDTREYDCDSLRAYYDAISAEKYYEDDYNQCRVVFKTSSNQIKSLASTHVAYIWYLTDTLSFSFSGYSEGSFDLATLFSSLDCDFGSTQYYNSVKECFGSYEENTRIYISAQKQFSEESGAYVSVYGFEDGAGRISVNAYGQDISLFESDILAFVREVTGTYLAQAYEVTLEQQGDDRYTYISGEAKISSFNFDQSSVEGLNFYQNQMDSYYEGANVSISVSKPFIRVYVPEQPEEARSVASSEERSILPPSYWDRNFVITQDRVYSSITLDENNPAKAQEQIKSFIDLYLATGEWNLTMRAGGGVFYPLYAEEGIARSLDQVSAGSAETASLVSAASQDSSATDGGIKSTPLEDSFASQYPEFDELEAEEAQKSLFENVLSFLRNLFSG
ncbi:hypothetical protein COT72_04655 [archaeon CG10_big_fil_rev_8_21_14_0_10_43_11]|nr:MAG: hypothetical protein COT72_04655 [archaeon CG10_big_fil_rev_8_21_14_0_10_43_11]